MRRICLDTSAYAHFKRGHQVAVKLLSGARYVGVPAIVLGELRTGFLLGNQADRNESELQSFLSDPLVKTLVVDDDAATIFAELMVQLRRAGTPLPTNDIWIAALAIREGATVLTFDAHFSRMRRVTARMLAV